MELRINSDLKLYEKWLFKNLVFSSKPYGKKTKKLRRQEKQVRLAAQSNRYNTFNRKVALKNQ
jgi:hypothetical protein